MRTIGALCLVAACSTVVGRAQSSQPRTQWSGVYTSTQAAKGRVVYEAQCARCHGGDLQGMPWPDGRPPYPNWPARQPALTGPEFWQAWDMMPTRETLRRIKISMPMNAPGILTDAEVADVLSYIFSVQGAPAGFTELTYDQSMDPVTIRKAQTP